MCDMNDKIAQYLEKAEQGDAEAQYKLAKCLSNNNEGHEPDYVGAFEWYVKAANQKYKEAYFQIAWAYQFGLGIAQDYIEANKWWLESFKAGDVVAAYNLAQNLRNNCGAENADRKEIFDLYLAAAKGGHKNSFFRVAWAYDQGEGVEQDYVEANKWWLKSAELGDASAQYNLANNLYNARGVEKADIENALKWYERAAKQGHEKAANQLEKINETLKNKIKSSQEEDIVFSISFESVDDANKWIRQNREKEVISMSADYSKSLGLFANHAEVYRISIKYRFNSATEYIYEILEEETTHLFFSPSKEDVMNKWKKNHPLCEIIAQSYATDARASSSSLLFGFGLDYVEHVKTVTLYRKRKQDIT